MKTLYLILSIGDSKKHYLRLIHKAYKKGYNEVVVIKLLRNRGLEVQLETISKSIKPGSVIVGHSLGALVAYLTAPASTTKLILCSLSPLLDTDQSHIPKAVIKYIPTTWRALLQNKKYTRRLTTPTTIIIGEREAQLLKDRSARLHCALSGRLITLKGCGHYINQPYLQEIIKEISDK